MDGCWHFSGVTGWLAAWLAEWWVGGVSAVSFVHEGAGGCIMMSVLVRVRVEWSSASGF